MKIEALAALHGDAILISFQDKEKHQRNILIDGGPYRAYAYRDLTRHRFITGALKERLEKIKSCGQKIDLLILSHIDDDHIGGILKWMADDDFFSPGQIGKVWFNSGRLIREFFNAAPDETYDTPFESDGNLDTSVRQGNTFEKHIIKNKIWDKKIIRAGDEWSEFGLTFRILSPGAKNLSDLLNKWKEKEPLDLDTSPKAYDYHISLKDHLQHNFIKEDDAPPNGSSIAFILSAEGKNYLFLADAHPSTIVQGLWHFGYSERSPLHAEVVKVAHHGSKYNTTKALLRLVVCKRFIISTNGSSHALPHKKCLADIIGRFPDTVLYFNYPELSKRVFCEQDRLDFPYFSTEDAKNLPDI